MCGSSGVVTQVPYIPMNTPYFWLDQLLKIVVYTIIAVGVFLVVAHIQQDSADGGVDKPNNTIDLQCYQCIMNAVNASYPGIPTDDDCLTRPTKIQQCDHGEICWKSWFGIDGTFMRGCMKRGKYALGCSNFSKPFPTTACFCDTNLCM